MTRQAPTLTWRPDSRTVARQGSPFGPRTGSSRVLRDRGADGVVEPKELRVCCAGREPLWRHSSQQLDGIVLGATPQRGIEHAEQRPRVAVPAPRQVGGNGGEPFDPFGERGTAVLGLSHPACKLRPGGAAWEAVGHL